MGDPLQPPAPPPAPLPGSFIADSCHRKHESPERKTVNPIRVYDPKWNELYRGQISDIIDSCVCCSENKMRIGSETAGKMGASGGRVDGDTVIVSIATVCEKIGDAGPRAVCGAFYGPASARNEGFNVPKEPQTKQAANIYAVTYVLRDILKYFEPPKPNESDKQNKPDKTGARLCKVLILTESPALVQGISSDAFWKWKKDDFEVSKKNLVVNGKLFMALDDMMKQFWDERKIPVWFWQVEKGTLRDAKKLASNRLDEIRAEMSTTSV